MKNKYTESMDNIQTTPEMKARILNNVEAHMQQKEKEKKRNNTMEILKRQAPVFASMAAVLALIFVISPYQNQSVNETVNTIENQDIQISEKPKRPQTPVMSSMPPVVVSMISVQKDSDNYQIQDQESIKTIIDGLKESQKTTKTSVQDQPVGVEYYFVKFNAGKNEIKFYAYENDEKYYIEVPYDTINEITKETFDVIKNN